MKYTVLCIEKNHNPQLEFLCKNHIYYVALFVFAKLRKKGKANIQTMIYIFLKMLKKKIKINQN